MFRYSFLSLFLFLCLIIPAQDQLFKTDNTKMLVKVTEVGTDLIKYKDFNNLNGPTYVITKKDVLLIIYENGTHEVINKKPEVNQQQETLNYSYKTIESNENDNADFFKYDQSISINLLNFANSEIGISYQKEFFKNHLNMVIPIAIGLGKPSVTQTFYFRNNNYYYINNLNAAFVLDKKLYDVGLGINYLPFQNQALNYYIGPVFRYMKYDATQTLTLTSFNGQAIPTISQACVLTRYAFSITNGILLRTRSRLTTNCFVSIGYKYDEISDKIVDPRTNLQVDPYSNSTNLFFYFGVLAGFSF